MAISTSLVLPVYGYMENKEMNEWMNGATSKGCGLVKKISVLYPSNGYEIVTLTD